LAGSCRGWRGVLQFVGGQRSREEVTLAESATHFLQEEELIFGLDAFCDDIHAEDACELNDGLDDLEGLFAAPDALDEGAIDFEDVEGESVKVAKGAVAGAEVVHVERHAEVA
jgi:hypothetical protein